MKTLGEKLRLLRTQKSWSQEDVAHELGMSLPGYSKIERDKTDISLSRLKQIADLYTLTLIELFSIGESDSEIKKFEKLISEKDDEIMKLQKKIIELMEEK